MHVPILMYHEIETAGRRPGERYTVRAEAFERQLAYLSEHGYKTVSLDEALATPRGEPKRLVITFDDNHLSHHSIAVPLLKQYGYRATFFIVGSFVGQAGEWLDRRHLVEMRRDGMSIESHSHTHRFLDGLPLEELDSELKLSKQALEEHLGASINFVSCPGGRYAPEVANRAMVAGYRGVCTSAPGLYNRRGKDPVSVLGRFLISAATGMDTFSRIVSCDPRFVFTQRLRHGAKQAVKRIMGDALYDSLWRKYVRDL